MRTNRWVKRAVAGLVLAALGYAGFVLFAPGDTGEAEYREAVGELDRAEPGWRSADPDHLAGRDPAADLIVDVSSRIPLDAEPPGQVAGPAAIPGGDYVPAADLLGEARTLAELPVAPAAPATDPRDWLPGPPPESVRATARVARLLYWGGAWSARRGEVEQAVRTAAAIARAGRSLLLDPRPAAILVRLECLDLAAFLLGLTLAAAPVGEPLLDRMAAAVWEEPADAVAEFARADRAACHACLEAIRFGGPRHPDFPPRLAEARWHARALRALTRSVEFTRARAGQPLDVVQAALPELAEAFRGEGRVEDRAGPDWRVWAYLKARHLGVLEELLVKVASSNARVRCARAGLAAERHRLRRGAWPAEPAALVPEFIAAWPTDPRDGRPLRWRRVEWGAEIHGADYPRPAPVPAALTGGAPITPPFAVVFSLLDPAHRASEAGPP